MCPQKEQQCRGQLVGSRNRLRQLGHQNLVEDSTTSLETAAQVPHLREVPQLAPHHRKTTGIRVGNPTQSEDLCNHLKQKMA